MAVTTKTPRLLAAAKEFNIGKDTLVDFLKAKGFKLEELKPTTRLTEEMYDALQEEFQQDKVNKRKSDQIDLPKSVSDAVSKAKPEAKEEIMETEAPEKIPAKPSLPDTVAPPLPLEVEIPAVKPAVETQAPEEEKTPEPVPANEIILKGPKVVDHINLSEIDTSTRPKKGSSKKKNTKEEKTVPEIAEPVKEEKAPEAAIAPKTPETPEIPTPPEKAIHSVEGVTLRGTKIVGKIELPVAPERSKEKEHRKDHGKRKRKRIPIEKRPETPRGETGKPEVRPERFTRGRRDGRKGGHHIEHEINEKQIQEKIRETQSKLAGASRGKSLKAKYRRAKREEMAELQAAHDAEENKKLQVTEFISVSEFANLMNVSFADVISKCMSLGIMVSINQRLDAEVIELVAGEFGYEVEFVDLKEQSEMVDNEEDEDPANLVPRAPIVTIMGHVDHGKTSLLDYIRNASVVAGEVGGITQHIGAYEVTLPSGRKICFLDTPGHEAFTAMRARGATVGDIAVIVVAADDAIMPQTKEAISHSQAAGLPMIFAINKIDKEGANPEKIKEQLAAMNILVEDWGGKYQSQEISAKKGLNIDKLLEKILLEADLLELKANPEKPGTGTVIEASLDKGRGYVTTVLVQNGSMKQGDMVVAGSNHGRIKAMFNERGQRLQVSGPSTPVQVLGLDGAPQAGEKFKVFEDESEAKSVANRRSQILREQGMRARKHITLEEIGRRLALGNFKELNVIIKGDVDGSVEALSDSLQKLSTDEIVVNVVHKAVGQITESDVLLATASDAIIIGFQVRPSLQASRLAENENIEIRTYSIIYDAIEEIKSAMEGMLEPKIEEKVLSNLEVRETFRIDKITVAGCVVMDGKMNRGSKIHLVRDGIVIFTGELGSLKRFKDDVREVVSGMECGLTIKNYNDIKAGDVIEGYEEVEVKRTL
ncbi:MAG: translation initiation factor IF-2 [Chitinophagaceae bacterium]|nr:MAG: translation initiation factor IF-2 [Chitinophagaceae bacterium]